MELKHFDHDGRARFITFCTHKKIQILTNNSFCRLILEEIDYAREIYRFGLIGYVVMPEHVHLVLIPQRKTKIGILIGEIKRRSSRAILSMISDELIMDKLSIKRNGKIRRVLWQRRCYDHNCRTEESMWEKVKYCHNNPVKRGLVEKPEQWKWSSSRWYSGLDDIAIKVDSYDI